MKICITPNSFENAKQLISNKADVLILALKGFSNRANYYFNIDEINHLVNIKKETKIFVLVNSFIFEHQLETLSTMLKKLSKMNVDKVMFNDYAIAQIDYEQKLNLNLHYASNTLVTSYYQFPFFMDNKINSVSLPNELFLNEIKQIANNKPKNFELMLQVQGFVFIMHSRWNLVTNFQKYVNDINKEYDENKIIFIKELNKVYHNLIIQDEYGTHMFTGYELCCIKYLKEFFDLKIDYLLIDTFLIKELDYDLKINKIYKDAILNLEKLNDFYEKIKSITPNELSAGFVGGINDIKHLLKKDL